VKVLKKSKTNITKKSTLPELECLTKTPGEMQGGFEVEEKHEELIITT
jgi:hypothetical protein